MPDHLSDKERRLFRDAIEVISDQGYDDSPKQLTPEQAHAVGADTPPYHQNANSLLDNLSDSDWVGRDCRLHYTQGGISQKQIQRLRSGKIKPELRLDLHGLIPEEAQRKAHECLLLAQEKGLRCVLFIHGKGLRDTKNPPKLKNLLNQWLPSLENVLAFVQSCPRDGGSGAIYVLLSSKRPSSE